jgi:putative addiction module component (TIGR02574 family)
VTIAELKEMPVNQRMILMEEIWDTLSHEDAKIESPLWHKEILDERMKLIDSGKAEYLTIEQLKSR